jgi:hypothetical protein
MPRAPVGRRRLELGHTVCARQGLYPKNLRHVEFGEGGYVFVGDAEPPTEDGESPAIRRRQHIVAVALARAQPECSAQHGANPASGRLVEKVASVGP